MIIVTGYLTVEASQRERYLEGCVEVVRQARQAPGCLDFSIDADLLDPQRINVTERWESQETLAQFRGEGTGEEQDGQILQASVAEYDVADVRQLT